MRNTLAIVLGLAFVLSTSVAAQRGPAAAAPRGLTGKWQGETQAGRQVQLDVKAAGAQLTGTLTIDKSAAAISEGKVTKDTFSFKAPIDGRAVGFTGKIAGDEVELTHDGAKKPVLLKRMK
jgi:hypothetical protein